jgi:antitoxin MazE
MNTRVKKWRNSPGIRIPGSLAKSLEIKDSSSVEIYGEKDRIIIRPSRHKRLKDLLESITPENLHSEASWEKAGGRAVW